MKKIGFIWKESIYRAERDGIFRCNVCQCKILDANTGEVNGKVPASKPEILICPDCSNVVAFIKQLDDSSNEGYKKGEWEGELNE